jgi:peptidyl-prolyl cis-trans isomerase SurA
MFRRSARLAVSLSSLAVLAAGTVVSRPARAVVVEKVAAVVGDQAILLSDLHTRARPYLTQLNSRCPIGTPPCIPAENKIYQQTLERMVDEELEAQAAKRANVNVTPRDVDATIERLAQLNGLTKDQLFADVTRQSGMTEAEYRQEIRQQVIEGKLMQRVAQAQIRITKADLEEMFRRMVERERRILLYQPSWIVLSLPGSPTVDAINARMKEASELARRAREGADFAELARTRSEDSRTREDGGNLGVRAPAGSPAANAGQQKTLAEPLEKVALGLGLGEVSEPFRYKDAIVVLRIANRQPSRYTSFEAAQSEMAQRVQAEKLEKAKQKWLKDLRRRTHVDVRFL